MLCGGHAAHCCTHWITVCVCVCMCLYVTVCVFVFCCFLCSFILFGICFQDFLLLLHSVWHMFFFFSFILFGICSSSLSFSSFILFGICHVLTFVCGRHQLFPILVFYAPSFFLAFLFFCGQLLPIPCEVDFF